MSDNSDGNLEKKNNAYIRTPEKIDDIIRSLKEMGTQPVEVVYSVNVDSSYERAVDGSEIHLTSFIIKYFIKYPQIGYTEHYLSGLAQNKHAADADGIKKIMDGEGKKKYDLDDAVLTEEARLRGTAGIAYMLFRIEDAGMTYKLTDESGKSIECDHKEILRIAKEKGINPGEYRTHNSLLPTIDGGEKGNEQELVYTGIHVIGCSRNILSNEQGEKAGFICGFDGYGLIYDAEGKSTDFYVSVTQKIYSKESGSTRFRIQNGRLYGPSKIPPWEK